MKPRERANKIFGLFCFVSVLLCGLILVILLITLVVKSWGWINLNFILSYPSRLPQEAGIKSALIGSLWLIVLTAIFSVPIGVSTALYLEEYASGKKIYRFIVWIITTLAGVPSIIYGILGLTIFVYWLKFGRNILSGALTMSLLILPVIIMVSREAINGVPNAFREAGYALGATRFQVIFHHVLPIALPGIITGVIVALARALGEAAPLIVIGALAFVPFLPKSPLDSFTVLPIQIFNWASRPRDEFRNLSAAAIVVLLFLLFLLNGFAIYIRYRSTKRRLW